MLNQKSWTRLGLGRKEWPFSCGSEVSSHGEALRAVLAHSGEAGRDVCVDQLG